MKTIQEVWQAIMNGKPVYWHHEGYRITLVDARGDYQEKHFTYRNGFVLRVTCTSNWFGSLLEESELGNLFVTEKY